VAILRNKIGKIDPMTETELLSKKTSMLEEVISGLSQEQKTLQRKFFYEERSSKIFDDITEVDE